MVLLPPVDCIQRPNCLELVVVIVAAFTVCDVTCNCVFGEVLLIPILPPTGFIQKFDVGPL